MSNNETVIFTIIIILYIIFYYIKVIKTIWMFCRKFVVEGDNMEDKPNIYNVQGEIVC